MVAEVVDPGFERTGRFQDVGFCNTGFELSIHFGTVQKSRFCVIAGVGQLVAQRFH
jgi:hypothetical protein